MFINKILYFFSSTAAKKGIDNIPNDEILGNIKELDAFIKIAYESWNKYCLLNGIPETKFMIVSGYRSPQLNKSVGGVEKSPHTIGYAADVYIKLSDYWFDYCKWMSEFAKDCYTQGIPFDLITPEGNGKYNWMHISLKDYEGNQLMRSIETPALGQPFVPVQYGEYIPYSAQNFSETAETNQHIIEGKDPDNTEIEGMRGQVKIDKSKMSPSYARVVYIMKRLMSSLGLKSYQAAGVLGNILDDTNGRISTTISLKGYAGICRWTPEDQVRFRKLFMNDEKLSESNLMSQVSFLIRDLGKYKVVPKLKRTRNINESCMNFYNNYERLGERFDSMDTDVRKECSRRRGYSLSAQQIYDNYKDVYKDEWLVGYYKGNGVEDNPVEMGDDTKIWSSHDTQVSYEEIMTYASMVSKEAMEIDEQMKDWKG